MREWLRKKLDNFWEKYIYYSRQYYLVFLFLYLVLTGLGVYFSLKLQMESDITRMVSGLESYQKYESIKKDLGGFSYLEVMLELKSSAGQVDGNITGLINAGDVFMETLEKDEYLRANTISAFYQIPGNNLEKYSLLYLATNDLRDIRNQLKNHRDYSTMGDLLVSFLEKNKTIPLFIENILHSYKGKNRQYPYLVNDNATRMVVLIKPSFPVSDYSAAFNYIRKIKNIEKNELLKDEVSITYGGNFYTEFQNLVTLRKDIWKTVSITVIALLAFTILFFQSLRIFFVVGLPLFSGMTFTFSASYFLLEKISTIATFLSAILLGLGIHYGIHLYVRFKEERTSGKGTSAALVASYSRLSLGIGFAAGIMGIAFFSVMTSQFRPYHEFGTIALLGVLFSVLSYFLFFPFLIFFTEKINPVSATFSPVQSKSTSHQWLWIFIAFSLNVLGVFSLYNRHFDNNFNNLGFHHRNSINDAKIEKIVSEEKNPPIVYSFPDLDSLKKFHAKMEKSPSAHKGKSLSILSLMPDNMEEKLPLVQEISALVRQAMAGVKVNSPEYFSLQHAAWFADYSTFTVDLLPEEFRRLFFIPEGASGKGQYFYYLYPRHPEMRMVDFLQEFREVCLRREKNGRCAENIKGASKDIILTDILSMTEKDYRHALVFLAAGIILALAVFLRNFAGYILVLAPLVSGIFSWFGITWVLYLTTGLPEFSFNYISILGFPVLAGIGIDNGIHLFRKGQEIGFNKLNSIFKETGTAIFLSNFTVFIAFLSLSFSAHAGLRSLGIMTALGIVIIYLSFRYLFAASSLLFYLKNWLQER